MGDKAQVKFRFVKNPEFIEVGSTLFFREGLTRGVGTVTEVLSLAKDPDPQTVDLLQEIRLEEGLPRFRIEDVRREKWEIARDKDTKITGDLKVGSKVTIHYTMKAASVEVKGEEKRKRRRRSRSFIELTRRSLNQRDVCWNRDTCAAAWLPGVAVVRSALRPICVALAVMGQWKE
jgi:uncharacterized membrane protein